MERKGIQFRQEQLRKNQRLSETKEYLSKNRENHINESDILPPASEEQKEILRKVKEGKNLKIIASAGSGKTTTSLLLAKELAPKNILLVTYNAKLKKETQIKIRKYGLTNIMCYNYHSLGSKLFHRSCFKDYQMDDLIKSNPDIRDPLLFDVLILDELQDMTNLLYRFCIFFLEKLKATPQIVAMGDPFQTVYKCKGADEKFLMLADSLFNVDGPWEKCTLQKSFRVTKMCADFINECCLPFDAECLIQSDKPGPKIRYLEVDEWYSLATATKIKNEINLLMRDFNLKYEDIFVLAPSTNKSTPVVGISNELSRKGISVFVSDCSEGPCSEIQLQGKVVFLSFHQSKGLERKAVIVLQFDESYFMNYNNSSDVEKLCNELYVAITRSSLSLTLVHAKKEKEFEFLDVSKVGDFVIELQDDST